MKLNFDVSELTIGDIEDIENITELDYDQIRWEKPNGKLMKAMIYVSCRKGNPDFTLEDAGKVKLTEIEVEGGNPPVDGADS